MTDSNDANNTRGWDTYWAGARDADAYTAGGASHPAFPLFWDITLPDYMAGGLTPRILDIASGSGAVVDRLKHQNANLKSVTCVDISQAAIDGVLGRFPDITGVVANARSLPLESGAYDLITSQFGIEYAGTEAIAEAARLTAVGGSIVLLMHIRPGGIYAECAAALDAIRRTGLCGFVPRALAMFESGFAAVGGADRKPYDEAAKHLAPAIREMEVILADHGQQVAAGTIAKLYADVGQIHSRMPNYEPAEVLGWLGTMDQELGDYEQRMASMIESATDAKAFAVITEELADQNFDIVRGQPLVPEENHPPMAWVLIATRRESQ